MKAQSGLAGDRERRAEMPRPRFRGVTMWVSSIANMSLTTAGDNSVLKAVENATNIFIDADKTNNLWEEISVFTGSKPNNEVKHRPAAQQWVACTP